MSRSYVNSQQKNSQGIDPLQIKRQRAFRRRRQQIMDKITCIDFSDLCPAQDEAPGTVIHHIRVDDFGGVPKLTIR